jgi:hypothetical protein
MGKLVNQGRDDVRTNAERFRTKGKEEAGAELPSTCVVFTDGVGDGGLADSCTVAEPVDFWRSWIFDPTIYGPQR